MRLRLDKRYMKLLKPSLFIFALTLSLLLPHSVFAVDANLRTQVVELAVKRADIGMSDFMVQSGFRVLVGTQLLLSAPLDILALACQLKVLPTFAEQLDLMLAEADKMEANGGNDLLEFFLVEGRYREVRFRETVPHELLSDQMLRFWSTLDAAEQMMVAKRFLSNIKVHLSSQMKVEEAQADFKNIMEHTLTGTVFPPHDNSKWISRALLILARQPKTTVEVNALLLDTALKLK